MTEEYNKKRCEICGSEYSCSDMKHLKSFHNGDLQFYQRMYANIAMPDMLEEIFDLQKSLQSKMPIPSDTIHDEDSIAKQGFINEMWIALVVELGEAIQCTQWKNPNVMQFGWKKTQEFNEEEFSKELIDCLHFYVNLCLANGISAKQLYNAYIMKNKVNETRQQNNY